LILAAVGARKAWDEEYGRALLVWSAVCLTLVFVPWSLQRRFLTGLFFPLASISVFGLEAIAERTSFELRKLVILVLFLSIPTNLIVIISGLQAITLRDQAIFIDQDLISGLEWIDEKTEQDALVLVEVDDGLIVPSLTGRRVIYGHPFETIKAEAEIDWLDKFFNSSHDSIDYENDLNEKNVDYVLLNGHEDSDLDRWLREYWKLMFSANEVRVFARQ
jgi:hypothetical protein